MREKQFSPFFHISSFSYPLVHLSPDIVIDVSFKIASRIIIPLYLLYFELKWRPRGIESDIRLARMVVGCVIVALSNVKFQLANTCQIAFVGVLGAACSVVMLLLLIVV